MKKILMLVYAVCAMLVIIGSLLWFAFTLRSDSLLGKAEALKNFKAFTQRAADVFTDQTEESDPALLQLKLEPLCRNYQKYIRTVLIRDSAGVLFTWPQHTDIFSYTEQQVVEVKNLPLFFTAAQMHIPLQDKNSSITIHAALQTVPVETVFSRGQVVFFLLLLIVLLTITALIFSYIDFNSGKPAKQPAAAPEDSPVETGSPLDSGRNTAQAAAPFQAAKPAGSAPVMDAAASRDEAPRAAMTEAPIEVHAAVPLSTQLESLNRLHIYEDDHTKGSQNSGFKRSESADTAAESNIEDMDTAEEPAEIVQLSSLDEEPAPQESPAETAEVPVNAANTQPQHDIHAESYGSFENYNQTPPQTEASEAAAPEESPVSVSDADQELPKTHTLEQATIIEELTTAITETAVAEEDLTLLLIHANDLSHNQQVTHLLRGTLDRIHKVFTFNQDTLGLIIFYAPLDQGMQIANNLYDEVYPLLASAADKKSLGIGLTTRAGRLIPAHRMIEEASAATSKAIEEGGDPIVAFRVNPDKYRRCLARLS